MFCPVCKAEYREGFSHCSDCDVDLVHDLPMNARPENGESGDGARHREQDGESLRVVWQGDDQGECVGLCQELKKADIYYRVNQYVHERSRRMQVSWKYQIGVRPAECDRVKALLGIDDKPADSKDDAEAACDDPTEEIPEAQKAVTADEIAAERARSKAYLKKWYPDDAIVKVWAVNPDEDHSSTIQYALTENLIHFRVDLAVEGRREIFVQPEDESRAREIIREIEEGIIPE